MSKVAEQEVVVRQLNAIVNIFKASKGVIRPHAILTGPSGSGKSWLTEQLAEEHNLDFLEVNAAQLTKEGTAGNSLSKALTPLIGKANIPGIIFVDEFDKMFISGNVNSDLAHETTNGVQNEFLKVLESKTTSVYGDYGKYIDVPISNKLFIFAGAFNGEDKLTVDRLRDFGVKSEFLGRVGLIYNLQKLSIESMRAALEESILLSNYLKLFKDVKHAAVVDAVMPHIIHGHDRNTLGIRIINTLLHQYFINGGTLPAAIAESSTFQTTLTLTPV